MHARAVARLQVEAELRKAIENGELRLHYQPLVSLPGGRLEGFEALVRWQHPQRGLIGPGEFIPLAEETGLIVPLGQFVLREACRQCHDWRQRFAHYSSLYVSVNIAQRQLCHGDLAASVAQILREQGLPGQCLKLEITENALLVNTDNAPKIMECLKHLGVGLWLDDFGTGYSSLSYLRRLPIEGIKIDRVFIEPIASDPQGLPVVQAIVGIAHTLGLLVVAEGVEDGPQHQKLLVSGCDAAQGFYYARPAEAPAAELLLSQVLAA